MRNFFLFRLIKCAEDESKVRTSPWNFSYLARENNLRKIILMLRRAQVTNSRFRSPFLSVRPPAPSRLSFCFCLKHLSGSSSSSFAFGSLCFTQRWHFSRSKQDKRVSLCAEHKLSETSCSVSTTCD